MESIIIATPLESRLLHISLFSFIIAAFVYNALTNEAKLLIRRVQCKSGEIIKFPFKRNGLPYGEDATTFR